MGRRRPYSRRAMWSDFQAWVGRHRTLFLKLALLVVTVIAFEIAILVLLRGHPVLAFVVGALCGGFLVGTGWVVSMMFMASRPAAIRQLRGAWGEDNTTSELKRARRKSLVWGWVDSVDLERGDLDHVVVTRRGGLLVIDSKWRTVLGPDEPSRLSQQALVVARRAEALVGTVLDAERGRHRAAKRPISVRPVLVIWGPEQERVPPGGASMGEVTVVAGQELVAWLGGLSGDPVARDVAVDLVTRIERFVETRERRLRHATSAPT